MTMTVTTLNVSRAQIEADLRAGKSVEEIAQEWSEPRANVYAIKRALDEAARTTSAPPPRPGPPAVVPVVAVPVDVDDTSLTDLVDAASKSKSARTRSLGAKLDKLVEELVERLNGERAVAAAEETKRRERAEAAREVERLEAALREARAKLGRNASPANPSRSKVGKPGGASTSPAFNGGPPPSVIREWARANDVDCPRVGTLPGRVIAAYRSSVGEG